MRNYSVHEMFIVIFGKTFEAYFKKQSNKRGEE